MKIFHWPAYQSCSSRSVNCVFATKSFMITGFSFEFCFPISSPLKMLMKKLSTLFVLWSVSGERKMAVYRYWYIFGSGWYQIRALYFFLFLCFGRFFLYPRSATNFFTLLFNAFLFCPLVVIISASVKMACRCARSQKPLRLGNNVCEVLLQF